MIVPALTLLFPANSLSCLMIYSTFSILIAALVLLSACGAPARQTLRPYPSGSSVIDSTRFSIVFPTGCPVKYERESTSEEYGMLHHQEWSSGCDSTLPRTIVMQLAINDFPFSTTTDAEMDDLVGGTRKGVLSTLKGTVYEERLIHEGGTRGLELRFAVKIKEKDAYFRYVIRCHGPRLYTAMYWSYKKEDLSDRDVALFFDSFVIRE
jgi:hypothetical protein